MDLHLTHRHVLITGGSKGIGLACAENFLQEGARVTLVSRDPANLAKAVQKLTAHFPATSLHTIAADLQIASKGEEVLNNAENHFGPVDILVNSAGAAKRTPPEELNPEAWHAAMQAKYFSYIHMLDPTIKRMGQRGSGAVVNIIGAGGKVAGHHPYARWRSQCSIDACQRGYGIGLCRERRARQRRQSRTHADRQTSRRHGR